MGYGFYTLPDGREAGYDVEAECDHEGCAAKIDRGMGYLCGQHPLGHKDADEYGCGNYYCGEHEPQSIHCCTNPTCPAWDDEGDLSCDLAEGHEGVHRDYDGAEFTVSEQKA